MTSLEFVTNLSSLADRYLISIENSDHQKIKGVENRVYYQLFAKCGSVVVNSPMN